MSAVELSEKLLMDAGGWQAMKLARALCDAGRVLSAHYAPPVLKGVVQDAGAEFRSGLKIVTRTNVENICGCRASREWGTICAHSLAVGLKVLRPKLERVGEPAVSAPKAAAVMSGPFFSTAEAGEPIALHVILSPNFQAAWEKDQVMVGAEVEQGGGRILIHALDAKKTFRAGPEDLRVIEKLRELNGGALSGMMILPREKVLELLESLRGHARVTFGKTAPADVEALLKSLRPMKEAAQISNSNVATEVAEPEFSLTLEGSLNHLVARLQATYGQRVVTVGLTPESDAFTFPDPKNPARRLSRNVAAERAALERLTRRGFAGPDTTGNFTLKREHSILTFFAQELPHLQREWAVSIGARFTNVTRDIERIAPRFEIQRSGEDWFEMSVHLEAPGGENFSAADIQRLLQLGQNHVRLKNNRLAVFDAQMLDEFQNVLVDCAPEQRQPGVYRVNRIHAGYIDAAIGEARVAGSSAWKEWAAAQRQMEAPQPIPLGPLEAVLRPYQKHGVYWMNFLAENGLGGILADEMGLGKTLQALAFLKTRGRPSLIVCPSSLVYNWQREAERFTPELKTLAIAGANRDALYGKISDADLVITSYPLLRRDADRYRGCEFAAVILDEAQHIKNPETQNAQAATSLRAETRFVLTGTPIENSVRDLWSIMHFVMPGYLGSQNDFRERYEKPISGSNDSEAQQRLAKRMRPFLLRRIKKNVATELPDKIEQVTYCELTKNQADVYSQLLKESRTQIEVAGSEKNEGKLKMLMLTALLRLRQACCDLRLLKLPGEPPVQSSGKLELLDELLREAIDGGHRVLIFSQFVTMLQLLREHLEKSETAYCYLDGSTKNRGEEVDRFQDNPEIPVFLISLKAGGVGLNLTGADTVIHFDPWWNPAVEAQATDRAHRIGQKRVVTSFKLITKDTIEEKILNLQQKKRDVINSTMDNELEMSALSSAEIASLFA